MEAVTVPAVASTPATPKKKTKASSSSSASTTTRKKKVIPDEFKSLATLMAEAEEADIARGGIDWKKAHAKWDLHLAARGRQKAEEKTYLETYVLNPQPEADVEDEDVGEDDEEEEPDDEDLLEEEMAGSFIVGDDEDE